MLPKTYTRFLSSNTTHATTRHLHEQQTLGFCTAIQTWSIRNWARATEVVNLKSQCFFFLYFIFSVNKNHKARNHYFQCRKRYVFSFTLKLKHLLLQKLATFYMWNLKQKDDGVNQSTAHCCYGDYMTMNQQT